MFAQKNLKILQERTFIVESRKIHSVRFKEGK